MRNVDVNEHPNGALDICYSNETPSAIITTIMSIFLNNHIRSYYQSAFAR
jgi:hypothetical protein